MNTKTKPLNLQNQSPNTSHETGINNKNIHQNSLQRLLGSIAEVKKNQASSSKVGEKMLGIVLMSSPPSVLTVKQFASKYSPETSFYKSVMQKDGKVLNPKSDGHVLRGYCFIPEVCGVLPFPDLQVIKKFLALWNFDAMSLDPDQEEEFLSFREKEIKKMYPNLYKEFKKIVMYPIFYKYVEDKSTISPLQFVSLKFTEDFNTYFTGVIEEIHGEFYKAEEIEQQTEETLPGSAEQEQRVANTS